MVNLTSPPAQGREILRVQHRLPRAGSYVCSANYTGVFSRLEFSPEGKAMMPGRRVIEPVGSCPTYFLLSLWTCWPCGPRLWYDAPFGASCPIPTSVGKRGRGRKMPVTLSHCRLPTGPPGKCLCGFTTLPGLWEPTTYHFKELRVCPQTTAQECFRLAWGRVGPLPPGEGEPACIPRLKPEAGL